jgi:hypothetical protein
MALRFIKLGLAAAAGYYFFNRFRKSRAPGSTTNASDAVDDVRLGPKPSVEEKLDEGVQETFPASDPVSIAHPSETAYERKHRAQP